MTHRQVSLSPLASSFVTSFFFSHSIVFIIFTDILGVHINYDVDSITYDDFINRELILFSHAGNSDCLSPLSSHHPLSCLPLCLICTCLSNPPPFSLCSSRTHPLSLSPRQRALSPPLHGWTQALSEESALRLFQKKSKTRNQSSSACR